MTRVKFIFLILFLNISMTGVAQRRGKKVDHIQIATEYVQKNDLTSPEFEKAALLSRECVFDQETRAAYLNNLAIYWMAKSQFHEAQGLLESALIAADKAEFPVDSESLTFNLAVSHIRPERFDSEAGYQKALNLFGQVNSEKYTAHGYHYYVGLCYYHLAMKTEAIKKLQLHNSIVGDVRGKYALSYIFLEDGKVSSAVQMLNEIEPPNNSLDLLLWTGNTLAKVKAYDEAVEAFSKISSNDRATPLLEGDDTLLVRSSLHLADSYIRAVSIAGSQLPNGNPVKVRTILDVPMYQSKFGGCYTIGCTWLKENDWKNAYRWFQKASELNGSDPHSYLGIGLMYLERGEYHQAYVNLSKAIGFDPNLLPAYEARAAAAYYLEDDARLCSDVSFILSIDPSYPLSYAVSSAAAFASYYNLCELNSEDLFKMILSKFPDKPTGYLGLGILEAEAGKHEAAIVWFSEGLKQARENASFYSNRGAAYQSLTSMTYEKSETEKKKLKSNSMADLDRALEIDPTDVMAMNSKARLMLKQEKFKESIDLLEHAKDILLKRNLNKPYIKSQLNAVGMTLAWAYELYVVNLFESKQEYNSWVSAAEALIHEAIERGEAENPYLINLAYMYRQIDEFQKAIDLLEVCKENNLAAWNNLAEISMHINSPNHADSHGIFSAALEKCQGSEIHRTVSENWRRLQSGIFEGTTLYYFDVSYSLSLFEYEGEVELPPYLFKPRLVTLLSNFPVIEASTSPCTTGDRTVPKNTGNSLKQNYPHAIPVQNIQ